MRNALVRLLNRLLGVVVRRRVLVRIGSRSKVQWWAMRSARDGQIVVGEDCNLRCRISFDSPRAQIFVGDRCFIGASHLVCHSKIEIGDDVIISWGVTIVDHDSHPLSWSERRNDVLDWAVGEKKWRDVNISPVIVGARVWIGFGASILKGVSIGEGAVVGANAVVTRDVPPYTVVAGNPARVIRNLSLET